MIPEVLIKLGPYIGLGAVLLCAFGIVLAYAAAYALVAKLLSRSE